jgi:hypothetical protein
MWYLRSSHGGCNTEARRRSGSSNVVPRAVSTHASVFTVAYVERARSARDDTTMLSVDAANHVAVNDSSHESWRPVRTWLP